MLELTFPINSLVLFTYKGLSVLSVCLLAKLIPHEIKLSKLYINKLYANHYKIFTLHNKVLDLVNKLDILVIQDY